MYALITADQIDALANRLPVGARRLDTGQWVTPPDGQWTTDLAAACGWFEVTETPRPDDTTEGTHTSDVAVVDGLPVRTWMFREWTPEELAGQADATAQVDRFAAVESAVLATVDLAAKPWTPVTGAHDAVPPLAERIMDDGHTYRNVSGQWLSHSPYEYPRGYECLDCTEPEPDPDTGVLPWTDKGSPSYKTGDLRTWPDGSSTVYRCRQDHTAHEGAGYDPSVASLWEIAP